ncbi:hypothetical protein B0T10DRAFT_461545 [Thelonectria olida]|uniref:Ubiquitin-like protease family profile domain-containing protein n=1 Tax=Thelonectria olida TaxID=1576542 RepID=A0A9P8W1E6_9HYPO|nr:hypothetical protein B0T10DRAFT_461545 [Thelonectria olida]
MSQQTSAIRCLIHTSTRRTRVSTRVVQTLLQLGTSRQCLCLRASPATSLCSFTLERDLLRHSSTQHFEAPLLIAARSASRSSRIAKHSKPQAPVLLAKSFPYFGTKTQQPKPLSLSISLRHAPRRANCNPPCAATPHRVEHSVGRVRRLRQAITRMRDSTPRLTRWAARQALCQIHQQLGHMREAVDGSFAPDKSSAILDDTVAEQAEGIPKAHSDNDNDGSIYSDNNSGCDDSDDSGDSDGEEIEGARNDDDKSDCDDSDEEESVDENTNDDNINAVNALAGNIVAELKSSSCRITSEVMHFFCTFLPVRFATGSNAAHNHVDENGSCSNVQVLDPLRFEVDKGRHPTQHLSLKAGHIVYVPLHHKASVHWTLVRIEIRDDRVDAVHYNSLAGTNDKSLNRRVESTLNGWLHTLSLPCSDLSVVWTHANYPRQPDPFSCGVFVLGTLSRLLQHQSLPVASYPNSERRRLLALTHCQADEKTPGQLSEFYKATLNRVSKLAVALLDERAVHSDELRSSSHDTVTGSQQPSLGNLVRVTEQEEKKTLAFPLRAEHATAPPAPLPSQPVFPQPLHPTSVKRPLSSPTASPMAPKRVPNAHLISDGDEDADARRLWTVLDPQQTQARISAIQAELCRLRLEHTKTKQHLEDADKCLKDLQRTLNRVVSEQKILHQERVDQIKDIFAAAFSSSRALIDSNFPHQAGIVADALGLTERVHRESFSLCQRRGDEIVTSATEIHREVMTDQQGRVRRLTHQLHETECQVARLEVELGVLSDVLRARALKRMLSGLDSSALSRIRE